MSTSTPIPPSPRQNPDDGAARQSSGGDPPVREVLVGVDGSDCALRAVRWAAEEAERRQAPLRIVHAAPYLHTRRADTPAPDLPRARQITGQAYTAARHTAQGVRATAEVVPEDPVRALLRAAETAQLVVLGISTTGTLDELILAPVAHRVVARSPQPVVVVPRRRGPEVAGRPVVALLGLADPEDDGPVLEEAAEAARRLGVPLEVVRNRTAETGGQGGTGSPADWSARYPEVDIRTTDLPGASPRQLLGAACPSPLIVTTAGHGGMLHRPMDGAHRYLLRHCTSPMILVPPVHRPQNEPREEIIALG